MLGLRVAELEAAAVVLEEHGEGAARVEEEEECISTCATGRLRQWEEATKDGGCILGAWTGGGQVLAHPQSVWAGSLAKSSVWSFSVLMAG